ncbi:MAG: transglutaminase family protein [Gammaproteobacteria bacterium]|nr:transglutaminase family protein [Gammaproteobacteria bacterium]
MTIKVAIDHRTEYRFDRLVNAAPHVVRLRPAPHCRTPVQSYSLRVEPGKHFINWQQDPFGNFLARLVFPEPTRFLSFEVSLVADMTVINPFDFFIEDYAEAFPFAYEARLARDLAPYLEIRENGPRIEAWLDGVDRTPRPTVGFFVDLNLRLQQTIAYVIRMEPGVQSCEETLELQRGSCRDSAWLLVQCLRRLGFAARFASGYLVQIAPDVKPLDGPAGPSQDFTDLHAWAEVFIPGAGWVGMDPTSGLFAGEGHIPLSCTPDPVSAAPITGATDPCAVEFYFHNKVERIHEDPRVTRPYTATQWRSVCALGEQVEAALTAADVRLTQGGEPTFVSIDDMESAQWNTAALGTQKRTLAEQLLRRLQGAFAPGGVLQFGQGKWYPGEPVPRWALSIFWRRDGVPLWRNLALLESASSAPARDDGDAQRFIAALAARLGVDPGCAVAGYEDAYHYLLAEGRLPANVEPLDSRLADPLERARLRRLFSRGLDKVVGYALPLAAIEAADGSHGWRSCRWTFRRERMYLLPGDSPMGLRLPLASLPWTPPEARDVNPERDPFAPRPQLSMPSPAAADGVPADARAQIPGPETDAVAAPLHTALVIEPRDGTLHVFVPPCTHLEHYLDLVTAIEAVATELGVRLVLEGYDPPHDPRVERLQITPDPGVIEVNVHPARSWSELVAVTERLYEEARLTRLGTEKFMLDGRHNGTGGGNHVTLGGVTAADSPFLRRPELLRSLVAYWQNHPSLSYLFSGQFIGPTSQAPRVDEARDDNLYELGIAFQQIPAGDVEQPWLVDRLLRHLLVDVTGNTHRAEFCIDKLYSPDSASGRRGLVEFRGFEMPPHPRMSLVQMLLLRALVAQFWNRPYRGALIRWHTELHDRFMLPAFLWQDLKQVLADLRDSGYAFDNEWFRIFLEFRCPAYGSIDAEGIHLELRGALEPWHVLGEEVTGQGTARYVDSSVERLQVRVQGITGHRYTVACNGRILPLRSSGTRGEYIAGVRFKAWQPPSGLHPAIGVHTPLVIDVVDTANRRAIAGCTYHVSHPGGRNYETFPVNANEAEARRIARFFHHGHSPGPLELSAPDPNPDHPYTLDLRFRA